MKLYKPSLQKNVYKRSACMEHTVLSSSLSNNIRIQTQLLKAGGKECNVTQYSKGTQVRIVIIAGSVFLVFLGFFGGFFWGPIHYLHPSLKSSRPSHSSSSSVVITYGYSTYKGPSHQSRIWGANDLVRVRVSVRTTFLIVHIIWYLQY